MLRIIGDVHGHYGKYLDLIKSVPYSLQVGDLGFDYSCLDEIDPTCHRVLAGNHDNYTRQPCRSCKGDNCTACQGKGYIFSEQTPHFLGDYGVWNVPDFQPIFFVRGAWSIDWQYRIPGVSWWEDEEISYSQGMKALELYSRLKPSFVVTHTAPSGVIPKIPFERLFGNKVYTTRTETLLQQLYDLHQPETWLFGHFHVDWDCVIRHPSTGKETKFICLDELSYRDF